MIYYNNIRMFWKKDRNVRIKQMQLIEIKFKTYEHYIIKEVFHRNAQKKKYVHQL